MPPGFIDVRVLLTGLSTGSGTTCRIKARLAEVRRIRRSMCGGSSLWFGGARYRVRARSAGKGARCLFRLEGRPRDSVRTAGRSRHVRSHRKPLFSSAASSSIARRSMRREPRAFLWNAQRAAEARADFRRNKTYEAFAQDLLLRSAVERQFEIIGQALAQLAKHYPKIPSLRQSSPFAICLIHGYAVIDRELDWRAIQENLPELRATLATLLASGAARGLCPIAARDVRFSRSIRDRAIAFAARHSRVLLSVLSAGS